MFIDSLLGPLTPSLSEIVRGKHIAVISHSLGISGAPKMMAELGNILLQVGEASRVLLAVNNPAFAFSGPTVAELRQQLEKLLPNASPRLEITTNIKPDVFSKFDAIIVSSAHVRSEQWIKVFRESFPDYNRLLWWIHEGRAFVETGLSVTAQSVHERLRNVDAIAFETWTGQVSSLSHARFP